MNNMYINLVIVVSVAAVVWSATMPVRQCDGLNFEGLQQRITVEPCGSKKCKLTKGTNTTVSLRFHAMKEVKSLKNEVFATVANIPLPFIGVTGQSACEKVTRVDTGEAAPCPLAPGHEYAYTNVFTILDYYPLVDLIVHWSLNDGDTKVICFEVPATIKASK